MRIPELIARIGRENFPEDLDAFLENFTAETLLKSETLQQAFEVTDAEMEALYREGYQLYIADKYQDASVFFRFLVILNPFQKRAWMGLAACQQLLNEYTKALHGYAICTLLDREDPQPHLLAQACYEALGNPEEATKAKLMGERRLQKKKEETKLGMR